MAENSKTLLQTRQDNAVEFCECQPGGPNMGFWKCKNQEQPTS